MQDFLRFSSLAQFFGLIFHHHMMTHFSMLQRNLLYTGVTRAKTGLILVDRKKAVGYCVRNVTVDKRNTLLAERLSGKI